MTLPKNFIASVCLAVALAGVAVITAAVGQTRPSVSGTAVASAQSVPVSQLSNPDKLRSTGVVDWSGKPIGKVSSVKTGPDGKAIQVKVTLNTWAGRGRVASIRADKLNYDASKGLLVAQLTAAELGQVAATASSLGPGVGQQTLPGTSPGGTASNY